MWGERINLLTYKSPLFDWLNSRLPEAIGQRISVDTQNGKAISDTTQPLQNAYDQLLVFLRVLIQIQMTERPVVEGFILDSGSNHD